MAKRRTLTRSPTQPGGLALDDPFVRSLGVTYLMYGGLNWDFASNRPLQSRGNLPIARAQTLDLTAPESGAYRIAMPSEKTQSYTMGVRVRMTSGNTNYCPLMGLMYDQAGNAPYGTQIDLIGGQVRFAYSANGLALATPPTEAVSSVASEWIWVTFRNSYQALYKGDRLLYQSTDTGTVGYTATSVVGIGSINADGRTPGCEIECAIYVPRELSVAEMAAIMANPARLAANPQRVASARVAAAPSAIATPTGITATASIGTAAARGAANSSAAGVGAVASVGTATATGSTVAAPAGVNVTASVGTATASGAASSVPAGVSASSSIGIATATGAARATPAGVSVTASVGAATATTQDGALTATLRQVATGTHIMNMLAASNTTTYSRTPHVLMSAVSSLAIVLPNWYVGGQTESNAGSATWTASIEYPVGNFQQVTFSGATSVTAATGGNIVSDQMPVTIPKGAKFWVRLFQNAPSRAVYFNYYAGDGTAQFVSPSTDLTMGGTATTSAAFQAAITAPIAIIGMSSDPAIGIYGDSISVGRGDTADSGVPLQGHLGRAFGAVYAAGHVGISGDRISTFLAGNSKRVSLAQYFTHFAINMGINDVTNGDSAATIASNTNAMVALFLPNSVALCTLSPVSSSTNAWTTTANQTTGSSNGNRVTENARRLAGVTGVKVLYDVNPAVESVASPESGIWKAPSYTADGTHPAVTGYKAEAASINPALLIADAPAAPLGVTAIASVGTATASGAARVLPAGVTASASTGTATATGNATAAPAGVAATASITAPSARGAASASPSGITATASVGQASATAGGAGAAMPAGVGATASVGTAAARGAANVLVDGLTAFASVGTATASAGAGAIALPGGVTASTSVGQVAATGGAVALPAGVGAAASVGQAVAAGAIVIPATAMPLGVTAYARVGTATASGGVLYARAPAGSGFTPQRQESQDRPANTQRNYR